MLVELGRPLIEAVSAALALRTSSVMKITTVHAVLVAAVHTIHDPYILVVISPRLSRFTDEALAIWIGIPGFDCAYHLASHQLPLIGSLYALPVSASRRLSPYDAGQYRAVASLDEEPGSARKLLSAW
jgi:hypothetical protein